MFQPPDPLRPDRPQDLRLGRGHTVSSFDADLRQVAVETARVGGMAEELLSRALTLLSRGDLAEAAELRALRDRQRRLAREANDRAASLVALRQPMGADLRQLLAALRALAALARSGDLSANLAEGAARLRAEGEPVDGAEEMNAALRRFGLRALAQLSAAISAHQARDAEAARAVWRRDGELDAHHEALTRALLDRMAEGAEPVVAGARRLFMAKDLERIGDQARHVAAATWWMLRGAEIDAAAD
ncbi:phosphate uptake regulator PhoU [Albimonas sp. CAU 1670]|uniref:phosphate signaling complex PhoU family protein n=1 Tax=Albimonas sp. CAU 1670 TaxID=3032599 RepID=UPI0023D97FA8|nr:phosphate uptake regulator PhoU [Albimonas sp. CAU 1670]MDF2234642.1 phosphate uptake regulator PhoU [Albimonas sp. CAU 1670]